ncbi:hypothetical protein [Tychonema sp. BBK16]|uniref:hypothetical protein n=1 Tax=Tychonema sp. BBK16 TaxID=2699888 RepID=UPI001F320429|nr:hypothetical protein [Tychonema sp. BBK16]MCF6374665.1 hypothetical protein [Tychonema sp. BBK16]
MTHEILAKFYQGVARIYSVFSEDFGRDRKSRTDNHRGIARTNGDRIKSCL